MSSENRPEFVYCIVKNAVVRKRNGEFVCSISFGNKFRVLRDCGKGRLYGECYKPNKKGYIKYRGFVKSRGFTRNRVVNMSGLLHRNITGRKIPTAVRYKGQEDGQIKPGEIVKVFASVNGWMLTGKGWTKAKWLEKKKEAYDAESVRELMIEVMTLAVHDYRSIVKDIRKGKGSSREMPDLRAEFMLIRKMFIDGHFFKAMRDSLTGIERLQMLDKELGVTDEWIRQMLSKKGVKQDAR